MEWRDLLFTPIAKDFNLSNTNAPSDKRRRMDDKRSLLRHFLAALAYRTQKALRDAPPEFADFRAAPQVRTPHELIRHMDSLLGYSRTFFLGGAYQPPTLPDFSAALTMISS